MILIMLRKRRRKNTKGGEAGFTMVELIIVIVLTSILGTFVFNILAQCLVAQRELQVRREHSDDAVLTLHQMSRDIMETTTVTTGTNALTLTVDSVSVAYSVVGNQLLRNTNIIARDVASLTATDTGASVNVSLSFIGETGQRQLEVVRRN